MSKAGIWMKRVALAIWHGWLSFAELFGRLMLFLIMTVLSIVAGSATDVGPFIYTIF